MWRWFVDAGINVITFGLLVLAIGFAEMPRSKGNISIAEFSENYNQLSKYYGIDTVDQLDSDGK